MEMLLCRLLGPLLVRFPTGWGADRCSGLSTTSDLPSRVAGATALCQASGPPDTGPRHS